MGVKWLLRWRPNSAAAAAAAEAANANDTASPASSSASAAGGAAAAAKAADDEVLLSLMEQLGAKLPGIKSSAKTEIKCHILKQQAPPQQGGQKGQAQGLKELWLFQSTEAHDTCFLVDRARNAVLEADNGMLTLVEKKLEYRIRTAVTFSSRRFVKGDFSIRVTSISASSMAGNMGSIMHMGHMVEVEYLPVSCPTMAAGMLWDFLELLRAQIPVAPNGQALGSFERCRDQTERYPQLPSTFSHQHTAVLYVDLSMMLLVQATHSRDQQRLAQQQQLQQQQQQQQQQASAKPG